MYYIILIYTRKKHLTITACATFSSCCLGDGLESVFDASMQKRAWDNFTKPQRKTITQWKEHIQNLIGLVKTAIKNAKELRGKADEPAAKKMKSDHSEI